MRDTQIRAEVVASKNLPQKPFPLSLLLLKAKANETFLSVFWLKAWSVQQKWKSRIYVILKPYPQSPCHQVAIWPGF